MPFSCAEKQAIDKYWGKVSINEVTKKVNAAGKKNRTVKSVREYTYKSNMRAGEIIYKSYNGFPKEVDELIKDRIGVVSISRIIIELKKMGYYRTERQIKTRISQLNLETVMVDRLTTKEVAEILGVTKRTVCAMKERGAIGPWHKFYDLYTITIKDFWKSMQENRVSMANYTRDIIKEPEWVKERIEKDKERKKKLSEHDNMFKRYVAYKKNGLSNKEIAKKLGITTDELRNIVYIRLKNNPNMKKEINLKSVIPVTEQEEREMQELSKQGEKVKDIAEIYSRNKHLTSQILIRAKKKYGIEEMGNSNVQGEESS